MAKEWFFDQQIHYTRGKVLAEYKAGKYAAVISEGTRNKIIVRTYVNGLLEKTYERDRFDYAKVADGVNSDLYFRNKMDKQAAR
jgi:hypothetical protein